MTIDESIKWQEAFKSTYKGFPKQSIEASDMAIKALKIIEGLKAEMKAMKVQISECTNADFLCGYISAISTLEGYLAMLENGGCEDGKRGRK